MIAGPGTDVTIARRMVPAIHRGARSHLTSAALAVDEGPQPACAWQPRWDQTGSGGPGGARLRPAVRVQPDAAAASTRCSLWRTEAHSQEALPWPTAAAETSTKSARLPPGPAAHHQPGLGGPSQALARHTRRASLPWSARPRRPPCGLSAFLPCSAGVLPWPAAGGLASIVRIDRRPSAQLGKEHAFLSSAIDGAEPGIQRCSPA